MFNISIIIINYNTFEFTCNCISSVIKFTKGVTYEIILVDNASKECEPDKFKEAFPGIKLIKNQENLGFAVGNNIGIQNSEGEYILLLNSDTILNEDSVSICYDAAIKDKKIGVVTCMLRLTDGTIQPQCQRFPSVWYSTLELFRIHKLFPQPARGKLMLGAFFNHVTDIDSESVWGTFFMFPKKILEQFEGKKLHEDFFMYAEDLLWCYTIKKLGYRIHYVAETYITHISKGSSAEPDAKLRQYNVYRFVVKYHGVLYAKLLMLIRALLYLSLRFNNKQAGEISKIYFGLVFRGKTYRAKPL